MTGIQSPNILGPNNNTNTQRNLKKGSTKLSSDIDIIR